MTMVVVIKVISWCSLEPHELIDNDDHHHNSGSDGGRRVINVQFSRLPIHNTQTILSIFLFFFFLVKPND